MLKIKTQLQVDILFQWDETIVTGHWSSLTLTAQSISQSYSSFFFVNNIFVQNNWNLNPGILRGSSLQSQAINLKLLTHAWTSLFFVLTCSSKKMFSKLSSFSDWRITSSFSRHARSYQISLLVSSVFQNGVWQIYSVHRAHYLGR